MLSSQNELVLLRVAWCTETKAGPFCPFSCFAGSSLVPVTDSLLASQLCCNAVGGRGCLLQSLNQKDGHRFCDGYVFVNLKQARMSWEGGTSIEKIPPLEWAIVMSVVAFS